ncbi:hypothetical protein IGS68_10205 [Skermanella sp. TT6]|uniref:Uncharacterized protein n=1 Tax=Skermanella cutis TaxID=2775420 RepID=A0ABX7BGH6_9PROT|nr:hypothetical protein [Skermanella sp. TT6]QQP91547.1 hypothetical protein IGS68_10205 [Skermanella sp. TT6]
MPIPQLTQHGVLPVGQHNCTLDEVQSAYTGNGHRRQLWGDFNRFLVWVRNQPLPQCILIDGGFTSDKANPKDIDVVFDLTDDSDATRNHWFYVNATQYQMVKDQFRVDFWVYAPGAQRDLRAFFEYVRIDEALRRGLMPGARKGLLRIVP